MIKLVPSDQSSASPAGDHFGLDVAIDGDVLVGGSPLDDTIGSNDGSAYVFRFDGLKWVEEAKLTASDAHANDHYGTGIAIQDDLIAVGGWRGLSGHWSGAVYLYQYDGEDWIEEQQLAPADGTAEARFGSWIAIDGDLIVVGAAGDVNNSGAAYIFRHDPARGMWIEEAKLLPSDPAEEDYFGFGVAISGDAVVIGGRRNDDAGPDSGSAYLFRYDPVGQTWNEEVKLVASDAQAGEMFGTAVSIDGDHVIIGAWASENDVISTEPGSAYFFEFDGENWVERQKIAASDAEPGDEFGLTVSVSGELALIGASGEDDPVPNSGAAYLFQFDGSQWVEVVKLTAPDAADCCTPPGNLGDEFGFGINLNGNRGVIGADRNDDAGTNSGAAYVLLGLQDCNHNGELDICDITNGIEPDCNANGQLDICDISTGVSTDLNANGIPDDCDPDCNNNGIPDELDIEGGQSADVNFNGVPDECEDCNNNGVPDDLDIGKGFSLDCNTNGVPDECDIDPTDPDGDDQISGDCNANGVPDGCDVDTGFSEDCDGNSVPDECQPDCDRNGIIDACQNGEDCNENFRPDYCDIIEGISADIDGNGVPDECQPDCNENGIPDEFEIAIGAANDVNGNGVPDECEDCNGNGLPDTDDILAGFSLDCNDNLIPDECDVDPGDPDENGQVEPDCNNNGVPDSCDIADGTSDDVQGDGIPDECQGANADLNQDGVVNGGDLAILLSQWGPSLDCPPFIQSDLDFDCDVDAADLVILLGAWTVP